MDIALLRTFLEVARTRHFGRAADNLYLTQSAVSARIKLLEETVGVPLFDRVRNNIQLTPAGQRLVRHAESIVNLWNRASQQVAVRDEVEAVLAVSGVPSLWDIFLQSWLEAMAAETDRMLIQAEAHSTENQLRMLRDATLDLAFTFEVPNFTDFVVREITTISLVLVASRADVELTQALNDGYVLVDWGTSFANTHAREFPDMRPPKIRVGLGRIAHAFIKHRGGAAYLAQRAIQSDLDAGSLFMVEGAPVIDRPAYGVYLENTDRKTEIHCALAVLDRTLRSQSS